MEPAERNAAKDGGGLFQCGLCQRHYKRLDHLVPHVRSRDFPPGYSCSVSMPCYSVTACLVWSRHTIQAVPVPNLSQGICTHVSRSRCFLLTNPRRHDG